MGGKDNDWYRSYALWRGTIYSEIKEEQYKSEEYFKEALKWIKHIDDQIVSGSGKPRGEYIFKFGYMCEIMASYIKVQRLDKTQKIYKELVKEAKENGLEQSFALVLADFIYAQSLQDPDEMQ